MKRTLTYDMVSLLNVLDFLKETNDIGSLEQKTFDDLFLAHENPFKQIAPETFTTRVNDFTLTLTVNRTTIGYLYNMQLSYGSNLIINNSTMWKVFAKNTFQTVLKTFGETYNLDLWVSMNKTLTENEKN